MVGWGVAESFAVRLEVPLEACLVFRAAWEDGALVVRVGVLVDVRGGPGYGYECR